MRPRIAQGEGQIGFHRVTPDGRPIALPLLVLADLEPDRLVATHLEALDDALIIAAGRFGDVLGGGRRRPRRNARTSACWTGSSTGTRRRWNAPV